MDSIVIRGARTHNLKNIDLDLPRNQLIVITGLSGSGKSSLAFDTIFAEGQRRYVESLSAYARQFLSVMEKPDVDHINGLSPSISIQQKSTSHNPRSTVGTITEIYDYLRLLYARAGQPVCPTHHQALALQTVSQMVDSVLARPLGEKLYLMAPVVRNRKGEHLQLLESLRSQGYLRARIDGAIVELDALPSLDPKQRHDIDLIIDRFKVREDIAQRLAESFETAIELTDGLATICPMDTPEGGQDQVFSSRFACPECGYSLAELEPRLFSFNSPHGACGHCDGLGHKQFFDPQLVITSAQVSIAGGAIRGWDRRNAYYFNMMTSLAKHYGFDVETPYAKLGEEAQQKVLYGSGEEEIEFNYVNDRGTSIQKVHPFEGIIPNLERRFRETQSSAVREELSKYLSGQTCPECQGARLNASARHVLIDRASIADLTSLSIGDLYRHFERQALEGQAAQVAAPVVHEIKQRLSFLNNVGLDYLNLARSADTLSGGEAQRIRLASQIGAGLTGVMYVLDEPSIGLHQRDNDRLLSTLTHLRDLGNTVIVVEHDEDAIREADWVVDMGPGPGVHGGEVVFSGPPQNLLDHESSVTGQFLSGRREIAIPECRQASDERFLCVQGARGNNLKSVTLQLPVGLFTCVTGVSGSGKSTLINETLYKLAAAQLNGASVRAAAHERCEGLDQFDKVIAIDQSPIGRTPRSNPATYTGIFTPLRELFAGTKEARARGYTPGRFSFNVKGGRCEACQGDGVTRVEMHFLPDIYVQCEMCQGRRYNRETLEITYKGKNIHEILEMTIEEAAEFFSAVPSIHRRLQTLQSVGLSYLTLGHNATILSGGEAQRVKLSKELSKRDSGKTLYILDEPTTGLHFHDIALLLDVLHELRDRGNTIVVIEHNLDVIKTADWIVDLGPEGGAGGGEILFQGPPEELLDEHRSHTAQYLRRYLPAFE